MSNELPISTEDKTFNVLSLFDGHSCLQIALKELGITPTNYYASEIKKSAIQFTQHNFPNTKQLGDVLDWRSWKLPKIDLIAFGSPCFLKGTLVLTSEGYKDISEVAVSDKVLSHKGAWRSVLNIHRKTHFGDIHSVKFGKDTEAVRCTPEHPFYAVERECEKDGLHKSWSNPKWVEAKDLTTNHFVVVAEQKRDLEVDLTEDEAYLFGYYLAEGWLDKRLKKSGRPNYITYFAMNIKEIDHFKEAVGRLSYKGRYSNKTNLHISWGKYTEGGCIKGYISNEWLYKRFSEAGNGAINKVVPASILSAPINIQKKFLDGYMYGGGCFSDGFYSGQALNFSMILGLRHLVMRVYGELASVRFTKTPDTHIINGRVANQRDRYDIFWRLWKSKEALSYRLPSGLCVVKVKSNDVCKQEEEVYNLHVDEDNTYTVNGGYSVHNCQSFSGLNFDRFKNGGTGLSGTKSSLFFVAFDILEHLRQSNPDILFLAENVQGSEVISKFLKVEPIFMNNLEFSCSMRHRLWFTNIAAEKCTDVLGGVFYKRTIRDSTDNKNICLRLDKPSLHENGLWMPLASVEKMLSHPLSSGFMFEDGCNRQTGCVTRSRNYNKFGYSLVHQQGQYRYHTEGELRQMHCIPDWVQFPDKSLRVVQDLVGDGWSIKCATHILKHLPCIIHESSVQCSSL